MFDEEYFLFPGDFSVNLWTLCFVLQKVPESFKTTFHVAGKQLKKK